MTTFTYVLNTKGIFNTSLVTLLDSKVILLEYFKKKKNQTNKTTDNKGNRTLFMYYFAT